ncbi:MAG TPA: hypothetical protein V6D18_03140 [Thermosynechococcaceae cyanobacterium]
MNRASHTSTNELSHASQALAEFFAGVVLVEENGTLQPIEGLSENPPRSSEPVLEPAEVELTESDLTEPEHLDQSSSPESQVLVSLAQLRQWYAVARSRGQRDRLPRIQALGTLFKQTFGVAEPEAQRPFVGWSAQEVQWWLEDLSPQSQVSFNSAPSAPREKALQDRA